MTTTHARPSIEDYAATLHVATTPEAVVAALTEPDEVAAWWTGFPISERTGDELRLANTHQSAPLVMLIGRPSPDQVTWSVTSCDFMADWVGTRPTFTIEAGPEGTTVVAFHHVGLGPALDCFEQCRAGWNHFLPSLQTYLETGVGRPNHPRQA